MNMLVLSRKAGERIRVGENITVVVTKIAGNRVTIGIDAPDTMRIIREELPGSETKLPATAPSPEAMNSRGSQTLETPVSASRLLEDSIPALEGPDHPSLELAIVDEATGDQRGTAATIGAQTVARPANARAPLAKIVRQRKGPPPVNVANRISSGGERETHVAGAAQPVSTTPSVTEVELAGVNLFSFAISTTF